jgi:hypothetical protein
MDGWSVINKVPSELDTTGYMACHESNQITFLERIRNELEVEPGERIKASIIKKYQIKARNDKPGWRLTFY